MKWLALVAGLMIAASAQAQSRGTVGDRLIQGFSITSGVRWYTECPEYYRGHIIEEADISEQFYIGGILTYPLNSWAGLGGALDRDFTDEPEWTGRVYLTFHPWKR